MKFSYIALFDRHFQPFMQGRINTESLIFFFSSYLRPFGVIHTYSTKLGDRHEQLWIFICCRLYSSPSWRRMLGDSQILRYILNISGILALIGFSLQAIVY